MNRVLLRGGVLYGSGPAPAPGDLLLQDGRIAAMGNIPPLSDAFEIDCTNLAVVPGFIDAHSHSDLETLHGCREKIAQGVTTEVTGNCGFSAFPCGEGGAAVREFASGILHGRGDWGWETAGEYLLAAQQGSATNVVSLVGHGTLRSWVAGPRQGALPEAELDRMCGLLADALAGGAAGFSTGLEYAPGSSAPPAELERLCGVTARAGKVYATHVRNYAGRLLESLDEQLGLARRTGCRLQISHLQAVGGKTWHLQARAVERIEAARDEGVDVMFDCYPYVAGSTVLTQWLPQRALEGGLEALLDRIAGPERAAIVAEVAAGVPQEWSDLYVASAASGANRGLAGRHLAAIAAERGVEPAWLVLDLLAEERGAVHILEFNQSEDNLRALLTHPLALVVSDGLYVDGRPHPRLYGAFPHLLGEFSRRRGWLPLEDALHKITGGPAGRFGLSGRGTLAPGGEADVVVFDPQNVGSPATYEEPAQPPAGIRWVFRGGRPVVAGGGGNGAVGA